MKRERLAWLPAFLAGAAAATAAELSAGLLLYSGLGLLRALTAILAVQMMAFALGLWTAWAPDDPPGVEHVRRRWLLALIAFTAAATFAGFSRILGQRANGALGQGLGLALLGALPLLASGALLGSMGRVTGRETRGGVTVGAGAASGAAVGFLLTGFVFVPALEPSSALLACVIALSAGALLHGWVLDEREVGEELEARWTPRGRVSVEDRVRGAPRQRRRVLLEGGRVRGAELVEGGQEPGWQQAVLATVARGRPPVDSTLVYGTGVGWLLRALGRPLGEAGDTAAAGARPARVLGVEPNPDVRRLAMAHFPPGRSGEDDPWADLDHRDGLPVHRLPSLAERFDLVVIDALALGAAADVPSLGPAALAPVLACLEPGGTLVIGGLVPPRDESREGLDAWMTAAESLGADRLALAHGGDMFLVLAAELDAGDWVGGETAVIGRWSSADPAPEAAEGSHAPPDPATTS